MDAWASTSIDLYCERHSPAFWAEPLNAFSNLFSAADLRLAARLPADLCL